MITKILNNNLTDRTDNMANVIKALVGSWGILAENDNKTQNIYLGRTILTYAYGGTSLHNLSDNYKCMAVILYGDGTFEMKSIPAKETVTTSKEIDIAILIAQTM